MLTVLTVAVLLLLLLQLSLAWFWLPPMLARGRARRRGGYIQPLSPALSYTSPRTAEVPRTSTGCRQAGLKPVDLAGRALQHRLSKSGASGFSTVGRSAGTATAGYLGDRTRQSDAA